MFLLEIYGIMAWCTLCSDRDKDDVNLTGILAAIVYHFLLNWVDGMNYKKSASFDVSSSKQQFELYGKECKYLPSLANSVYLPVMGNT